MLDAIHELDYLLWLLGPVTSVSAEEGHVSDLDVDVEDIALASLRFASGSLGAVDLNFFEPAYRRTCLLAGSTGVASWSWVAETVTVSRSGTEDVVTPVPCHVDDTYRAELVDFFDAVSTGREPCTTPGDGVAAVRLAHALKRSAATGRRTVVDERLDAC